MASDSESSLDPCPHCQRDDFGNAGARTQHVRSCREEAKKYQQNQNGGGGAAEPQIERVDGNNQQTKPQRRQGSVDDLEAAGETMANGISSSLDDDAPLEERKNGIKKVASLAGGIINGVMEHKEQKAAREEQRAKQANLTEAQDKPQCECGLTFSRIPANADRISCPECGREYEVN